MTPTSYTVSWSAPLRGTPPFAYLVQYRTPPTLTWTDNPAGATAQTTQQVTTAQANTTYEVRVKVSNAAGENFSLITLPFTTPALALSESAEGTSIPPAGPIINADGASFTIANGQVWVNLAADATTSNVTELYYHLHRVYRKQTTANSLQVIPGWWYKTHAADPWTPSTDPTGVDSADDTQIIAVTDPAIVDVFSEAVTLRATSGGQVAFDGVTDLTSSGVTLIYYKNNLVYYQQGATGPWRSKARASDSWISATDPRGVSPPAVPNQAGPLSLVSAASTSITVSWPLLTTGSGADAYHLQYKASASSTWLDTPTDAETADGTFIGSVVVVTPPPPATGGPGTGPAFAMPVTGAISLGNGWNASRDTGPFVFSGGIGHYAVFVKTYWFQFASWPTGDGYFFNGCSAIFLDRGVFLDTPDVSRSFSVPGLPPTGGVIPVVWITAGAISDPVEFVYYAEPTAATFTAAVIVDFNPGRGDQFNITQNLIDAGFTCRNTSWGSWVEFNGGFGWIAFLNYTMTPAQIGFHAT